MTIEDYFEQPCWVIDPLPRQVPADSRGKYFAVEQYLLRGPHREALAHRVVRFLLKLYCYQPLSLFWPDTEQRLEAPSPEELADRVFTCLTGRRPAADRKRSARRRYGNSKDDGPEGHRGIIGGREDGNIT